MSRELIDNEALLEAYKNFIDTYDYFKDKDRTMNAVKAGYKDAYMQSKTCLNELLLDYVEEDTTWKKPYNLGENIKTKINDKQQIILFLYFKDLNLTEIGKVLSNSKQAIAKTITRIETLIEAGL